MVKLPVRNKSKDNPYTLGFNEKKKIYTVEFVDSRKITHNVEISEKIYQAFNEFELEDVSQIHKFKRHIEHSELLDETLYKRSLNKSIEVAELVEKKLLDEEIKNAINTLSDIQKRRIIKYYFESKNEYEIAKEENTTQQSVHVSLSRAKGKLKEILKNYNL